jgi:hypothetical protein
LGQGLLLVLLLLLQQTREQRAPGLQRLLLCLLKQPAALLLLLLQLLVLVQRRVWLTEAKGLLCCCPWLQGGCVLAACWVRQPQLPHLRCCSLRPSC